ncbi:MalY/PatB family protein [Anaeroselena agilis]|uniref:cysteine-S-conjugate beta-lyase n=1 Tax=Anaeroselena agilis TaxID=3063788 RepID=A0ABU3P304_9FIRM|nr:PatB family C-S lyase [Selenomonadales bacterium 4137-cl]
MSYNFDATIERRGTDCEKWDLLEKIFGTTDVLPFWVADMDFAAAPGIAAALQARASHPVYGYQTKEEKVFHAAMAWEARRHGWVIERDWILNTPGVVASLSAAVLSLTSPGDKIVIQPPVYPPFFTCVTRNGRQVVENPLRERNGCWEMDLADLERKLDPTVKMLILCSPHNPVGRVWTRDELRTLGDICLRHGITVLADEIHCDLVFPGHRHVPFASLGREYANASVTFFSPSKTFNIAGTYTSFVVLPDPDKHRRYGDLVAALDIGEGNLFGLTAAEAAYKTGGDWLDNLLSYLGANADALVDFARRELPGVRVEKPEGTYLAWLDFRTRFTDHDALKKFLIHDAKVGLSDGLSFGRQGAGFARFNFACPRTLMLEGLSRIADALRKKG